jgi:tetratricopeptide (TPR) repeat protein
MGAYARAEPLYQQALQIRQKVLRPEHPDTATSLNSLANLYLDMGDYARAEPLYQQTLQIRQKALGPEHPDTAASLNNLAELYRRMGAYEKAEPLYQQALQILQKALGPEHPDTATSLNNLALLYLDLGDYARAEPLYQQALQIRQKALGPEHPDIANSLNNLATLYRDMGAYARAEPFYQQALQIRQKALGPEHPDTAQSLNNLAALYWQTGAYAQAEPLYQQALQIRQKALRPEHRDTAASLNNLAELYRVKGDYTKAEPLYRQALQITQKALGPEHPDTAQSLENLALFEFDVGELFEAKALARQSAQTRLAILSKVLAFTSEPQRLAYQDTLSPYWLFAILDGCDAELAAAVLHYKGVVLDSLIEDRLVAAAGKESKNRDLVGRLAVCKQQLGQLLLETSNKTSAETNQKMETLEREVEQIEGQLARHVTGLGHARRALNVTTEQVQAVIPNDGVLIEYLRYTRYFGKNQWGERYGAIVLAATGPVHWIPLGSAAEVDATVSRYQLLVRAGSDSEGLSETLQNLYARLWIPIEPVLPPGLKRVILSPDGPLNFVSFATLLDGEQRFLAETYMLQYAASGRDLLREGSARPDRPAAVVFANPDFERPPRLTSAKADGQGLRTAVGGLRGAEKRDLDDLSFGLLPGTQREGDRLAKAFGGWHWQTEVFTGQEATKAALLRVHSPYILHLATHGFFEPEDPSDTRFMAQQPGSLERNVAKLKFFRNPMHRSGLALAGAQTTLEAWKRGAPPLWRMTASSRRRMWLRWTLKTPG